MPNLTDKFVRDFIQCKFDELKGAFFKLSCIIADSSSWGICWLADTSTWGMWQSIAEHYVITKLASQSQYEND